MDFSLAIIAASDGGIRLGKTLQSLLSADGGFDCRIFSAHDAEGVSLVESIPSFVKESFHRFDAFLFIGSLGICVRSIAPVLESKQKDPAVLNCDEAGRFVQPVISGHIGGGNALALRVSRMLGAEAVLTTSSDVQGLWPLDILGREDGWTVEFSSP